MTIDDEKLDELERCAEAATDGPWISEFEAVYTEHRAANEYTMVATAERDEMFPELGSRPADIDAAHIAAADPLTVLALVEEVRQLRQVNTHLKEIRKDAVNARSLLATIASQCELPPDEREDDGDFSEWVWRVTRDWVREFTGGGR